jgi:hypothetical protein
MGMDIYSSSGVVFSLEDALPAVLRKSKKTDIANAVESVKSKWKFDGKKNGLVHIKDKATLQDWIISVAGELVDKNGEYMDSLALQDLFEIVMESLGIELPAYSFDYWSRGRINGWDVPLETPCIIFESHGLFEKKMTKAGKRLANLLGMKEVEESTWTIMSV